MSTDEEIARLYAENYRLTRERNQLFDWLLAVNVRNQYSRKEAIAFTLDILSPYEVAPGVLQILAEHDRKADAKGVK